QGAFGLAFASEPRALMRAGFAAPQVMPGKARELLLLQFTTGRQTIFRGSERVLPGETIAIRNGRIAHRARQPALPDGPPMAISEETALAELERVLMDSVMVHQR